MKAIIPVAGAGTKLRPHTYTQPKPLIPVAGKPILGHIIDQLISVGVNDFVFVIGYLGEKIKSFVAKSYPNINAEYVVQNTRKGLGHAIWLTKDVIPLDNEVIIALGDTIIEADIQDFVQQPNSTLAIRKVDDPRKFGVAEIDSNGFIKKVAEKPTIPKSNQALVGWYKIKEFKALIDALDANIKADYKTQNEFQLTDGIMMLIKGGAKMKGYKVDNWYDCGQKEVLLEINAILLKKHYAKKPAEYSKYKRTIIVPPVYIGQGAKISSSIIGPNITIGDHAVIENSIVKESIIGSFTKLKGIVMSNSIIGSDSLVVGSARKLNIGDNTELDLS
ncbi:MAG: sugar phosphate nucleotidyltransferase [Chitinophagales bacterium]